MPNSWPILKMILTKLYDDDFLPQEFSSLLFPLNNNRSLKNPFVREGKKLQKWAKKVEIGSRCAIEIGNHCKQ